MQMQELLLKIISIPGILMAFTIHEFAHAITAYKLGDDTPKYEGRINLNPFTHIDIMGFLAMMIFGFGWARPVNTNPSAYKNYRMDDLKVSIAGPLANLLGAMICAIILSISNNFIVIDNIFYHMFKFIISYALQINVVLFILNLIPIPGFDGFHVLSDLFPDLFRKLPSSIESYGTIIFIICLLPILPGRESIFTYIVHIPSDYICDFIYTIFRIS